MHFKLHSNQSLVVSWSDPRQSDWNADLHVGFAHCNVVEGSARLVLCCHRKHKVIAISFIALDSITLDHDFVRTGIEHALVSCIINNCIAVTYVCATPTAICRHFIISHERLRYDKIESTCIFTDALKSELPV